jgi:hypothetical protein
LLDEVGRRRHTAVAAGYEACLACEVELGLFFGCFDGFYCVCEDGVCVGGKGHGSHAVADDLAVGGVGRRRVLDRGNGRLSVRRGLTQSQCLRWNIAKP